jgi:hypothetical protein
VVKKVVVAELSQPQEHVRDEDEQNDQETELLAAGQAIHNLQFTIYNLQIVNCKL